MQGELSHRQNPPVEHHKICEGLRLKSLWVHACNGTWEFITLTRRPEIIRWCINFIVIITEFAVCICKALLERRWDRVWKIANDFMKLILEATKHSVHCWKHQCSGCGHLSCCGSKRLQPGSNKFNGLPLFSWQRERPEVSVNMQEGVDSCTIVKCTTWLWIRRKSYMWVSKLTKHLMFHSENLQFEFVGPNSLDAEESTELSKQFFKAKIKSQWEMNDNPC